jgi:hypothetical protein
MKKTVFTARCAAHQIEVPGYVVTLNLPAGFLRFGWVVHRRILNPALLTLHPTCWDVSEVTSGYRVTSLNNSSRAEAIQLAELRLRERGIHRLRKVVAKTICQQKLAESK